MKTECISIDIETRCNVPGCPGQKDMHACKHALSPFTSEFVNCGIYSEGANGIRHVFWSISDLAIFLNDNPHLLLLGCNLKFDINYLYHKGLHIPESRWIHDIQLMAVAFTHKVSKQYQEEYEELRKLKQKETGQKFREARMYSLKILAPYFLHVPMFWEVADVSDENYVLKDCEYAYKLAQFFIPQLVSEGTWDFYEKKLMPWAKMIMRAERKGICIDLNLLDKKQAEATVKTEQLKVELDKKWQPAYDAFKATQRRSLDERYTQMRVKAIEKLLDPKESKIEAITKRYKKLYDTACTKIRPKIDFDSPKEMMWLLKDYFKYPVKNVKGRDTTGKAILNLLSQTRNPDLGLYLDYRSEQKLATSFYPSYREKHSNGVLYCNFNLAVTRTGRLSSSNPNLQQVPGGIKELFVARPGCLLATYDMSAIETMLIAYYTEDPILLDIIFSGTDFHGVNTKLYFPEISCPVNEVKAKYPEQRAFAKRLGYALFYGAGMNRIYETAQELGYNWPKAKCKETYENFKEQYRTVFEFKNELDYKARYEPIMNMFGRQHRFDDWGDIYMKNFNKLIQGSASDMVLHSAYRISNILNYDVLLLVHDEIVTEIPENKKDEAAKLIPELMTDYKLSTSRGDIPLAVEGNIAKYWKK